VIGLGVMHVGFDKKRFAELLGRALGSRSITQFGVQAKVDPGYISRLLRGLKDKPPSAEVIRRLASVAHGGVTVEQLLAAAGYLDDEARPRELTPTERLEQLGAMLRSEGATEEDVQTILALLESRRRLREAVATQADEDEGK